MLSQLPHTFRAHLSGLVLHKNSNPKLSPPVYVCLFLMWLAEPLLNPSPPPSQGCCQSRRAQPSASVAGGWDGTGWDGTGQDGMGWDGTGRDGKQLPRSHLARGPAAAPPVHAAEQQQLQPLRRVALIQLLLSLATSTEVITHSGEHLKHIVSC